MKPKRILTFLILAFMLFQTLACLPTPEHAYIANKADNVLEQRLNASPVPKSEPIEVFEFSVAAPKDDTAASPIPVPDPTAAPLYEQRFPDRWDEEAEHIRDYVTVSVHADVETKPDGLYPVYITREQPVTEQDVITLANKLLPVPKELEFIDAKTKEQWGKELQAYLDEVAEWEEWELSGRPDDGVDRDETGYEPSEVEQTVQWYGEQIAAAPDRLDREQVSDYSGYRTGQRVKYTLTDGSTAEISSESRESFNYFCIVNGCRSNGYVYKQTQYESDRHLNESLAQKWVRQWQEPALSRADAEAIVSREMERLGYNSFSVACCEPANLYDTDENSAVCVSNGWSFLMRRDFGGYPLVDRLQYASSNLLEYGDDGKSAYNKPIGKEGIDVFVDENGIQYFAYSSPKTVIGEKTPNIELLSFPEIIRTVRNALSACYPSRRYQGAENRIIDLEVYRMVLTPYTLRIRNEEDFYEIPCWVVFFDGWHGSDHREQSRERSDLPVECIVINAVDGTVVHEKAGY